MAKDLFSPLRLGALALPNRVVMAPMTRSRAAAGNVAGPLAPAYYRQRAGAGLIVAEGSQVSPQGQGYIATPGIHSDEQVAGWRRVTDAVHAAGGRIFLQLWHVGRVSHPVFQPDGALPVAPSAIAPRDSIAYTLDGPQPVPVPRALDTAEIAEVVAQFAAGAANAKAAGFDGVEIHGANGYLIDQFLMDGSNRRTDRYGGSAANRARLLLEVAEAVTGVWGAERVGVRLSPSGTFNDMADSHRAETFGHAVRELDRLGLAYLHLVEVPASEPGFVPTSLFRALWHSALIVCGGYKGARAQAVLAAGGADLVAFGRPYIANPDLVERLRRNLPLAEPDPATFYGGGAQGYTDYPALEPASA